MEATTTAPGTTASGPAGTLSVTDAEATAADRSVPVPGATIDERGWLVIHPEASGGGPNGAVTLAERQLEPGSHEDLSLTLDTLVAVEQTLYAMLHYDDPPDGEFTFPEDGDPAVTADGSPVLKPFDLTVSGGSPTATVEMRDTEFDPKRLSVAPGTAVEWVNRDGYAHDVASAQFHDTATSWDYESGELGQGETATYTFEECGVYEYYCTIHGQTQMCGAVLVGDVSLDEDLPCEGGGGGY